MKLNLKQSFQKKNPKHRNQNPHQKPQIYETKMKSKTRTKKSKSKLKTQIYETKMKKREKSNWVTLARRLGLGAAMKSNLATAVARRLRLGIWERSEKGRVRNQRKRENSPVLFFFLEGTLWNFNFETKAVNVTQVFFFLKILDWTG